MNVEALKAVALSIRSLSMEAVETAKSGHPGLPMGCAEFGAVLFGTALWHDPTDPAWTNRDRFVLSAGHGSMFLYSLLHLSGYALPMEELKKFRRVGSKTPGHPEYGMTPGVETTTGPLGQGFANAVGMALAERMLAARFNTAEHQVVDHFTYALAGDGCMMEGISYEAGSLAGHLGLSKLIVFYDSNHITIEGSTDLAFSEDVGARFAAMGWHIQKIDGHDFEAVAKALAAAKAETTKPSLVVMTTTIGKGSPGKAGTRHIHGEALGTDEIVATRKNLGLPEGGVYYVDPKASKLFADRRGELSEQHEAWKKTFAAWRKANPALATLWDQHHLGPGKDVAAALAQIKDPAYEIGASVSTRNAGGNAINAIAPAMPSLIGGAADLSPSTITNIKDGGDLSKANPTGRIMHFGIREHAMGAVTNGVAVHGGFRPFCSTFLVFADYMRPTIRLAAIMKLPIVFVFTHDSIFVGEDGPTHEPIEHVTSLRIIPNVVVIRPGDAEETTEAWKMALERTDGPVALILTRQNLPVYAKPAGWKKEMRHGGYLVHGDKTAPESTQSTLTLIATGSEISLALDAAKALESENSGLKVRVLAVQSRELLEKQDEQVLAKLLGNGIRVVIEAGVPTGWEHIATGHECLITLDDFGHSGPGKDVAAHMGLSLPTVVDRLKKIVASQDW